MPFWSYKNIPFWLLHDTIQQGYILIPLVFYFSLVIIGISLIIRNYYPFEITIENSTASNLNYYERRLILDKWKFFKFNSEGIYYHVLIDGEIPDSIIIKYSNKSDLY